MTDGAGMRQLEIKKRGGTLRFWGDWFGRPYDNFHIVSRADYNEQEDSLTIWFDDGERLVVERPRGVCNTEAEFVVEDAARVEWTWNLYGEPTAEQNRRALTYQKTPDGSVLKTSGSREKTLKRPAAAAVELV